MMDQKLMQLILLSDIHGSMGDLSSLAPVLRDCDRVLIAGDITDFGNADTARAVIERIAAENPRILAVSGNCDRADVDDYLAEAGMGLHAACRSQDGIDFIGVSGSLPCPGSTPNELGESRFAAHLQAALRQREPGTRPLVLVSHQPAYGTALDSTRSGGHAGSTALRDFIEREKPLLAVSGHIHEAAGVERIGDCTLVNPGPFRHGRFARVTIKNAQVSVQLDQVV